LRYRINRQVNGPRMGRMLLLDIHVNRDMVGANGVSVPVHQARGRLGQTFIRHMRIGPPLRPNEVTFRCNRHGKRRAVALKKDLNTPGKLRYTTLDTVRDTGHKAGDFRTHLAFMDAGKVTHIFNQNSVHSVIVI
jgi:hypothetical protein